LLLALSEEVLEICSAVHILADHRNPVSVVHRFIEVVAVKLKHVGMGLDLEQLYGFFL
jgi:hypothetical protein